MQEMQVAGNFAMQHMINMQARIFPRRSDWGEIWIFSGAFYLYPSCRPVPRLQFFE